MLVSLVVQNTSNEQFTLKSIAGDVYATSNGSKYWVGNVSYWLPQVIYANQQTALKLNVSLGLIGIVQDIIQAFQYGSFSQVLTFQANANVDNIQVPIKIDYKVGK